MSSESRRAQALEPGAAPLKPEAPAKPGLPGKLRAVYEAHPLLVTWAVLAVGMVAILLWAAHDVDLLLRQRLFLVVATVGLAGLCAWIIGWED